MDRLQLDRLGQALMLIIVFLFWASFTVVVGTAVVVLIVELSVRTKDIDIIDTTWLLWVAPVVGLIASWRWSHRRLVPHG